MAKQKLYNIKVEIALDVLKQAAISKRFSKLVNKHENNLINNYYEFIEQFDLKQIKEYLREELGKDIVKRGIERNMNSKDTNNIVKSIICVINEYEVNEQIIQTLENKILPKK